MTYKNILKEYLEVSSRCEKTKDKIIKEIARLIDKELGIDNCFDNVISFDRLKHKIDGPLTFFRIIKRDGKIRISFLEFGDELSYNIRSFNLGEVKFIYEVLYHKFYEVIPRKGCLMVKTK